MASSAQSIWLISEGSSPSPSLLEGKSYLASNASYIIYPLALLAKIFNPVDILLFLQSLALSLGVIPLFNIARKLGKLHFGTCTALSLVYGSYVSLHNLNLSGFSPAALALPAIFYLIYLGLSIQNENTAHFQIKYWALILWILACRADLGLCIAGFGALLLLEKKRSLGLKTLAAGMGWVILSALVVQTALGEGYPAIASYLEYGTNPLDVFWGMLSDPAGIISELRTRENFEAIVSQLVPLVFLPLIRPRYIMPVMPLYFFYLVSDVPADILGEAEQNAATIAFLLTAVVFALKSIGHVLVERVRINPYLIWILLLASLMFFIQSSTSSFYDEPWNWNNRKDEVQEVLSAVPSDAEVRASTSLLSSLAERRELYELKLDLDLPAQSVVRATENVDWIVLDAHIDLKEDSEFQQRFEASLLDKGWQKSESGGGVFSYRRK